MDLTRAKQRKGVRLSLRTKGALLVCIPLASELLFISVLTVLVWRAQWETETEIMSNRIIASTANVISHAYGAARALTSYSLSPDRHIFQARYDTHCRLIKEEMKHLAELVSTEPLQNANWKRFAHETDSTLSQLNAAKNQMDRSVNASTEFGSHGEEIKAIGQLVSSASELILRQRALTSMRKTASSTELQAWVGWCLFWGITASIIITIVLGLFYVRGILFGLKTLEENSYRLSAGKELLPPLSGKDEIGAVDSVFHRMANALSEARNRERAMIENAVDVICSIDSTGRFQTVSASAESVLGYLPDELLGQRYVNLVLPEFEESTQSFFKESMSQRSSGLLENRMRSKDGTVVDILWSMRWSQNDQTMFCVLHNITERKEMERLRQEFVAVVSHELRTPLSSLRGLLTLISVGCFGELTPPGVEKVKAADNTIVSLVKMITNLLDLAKMEAGKGKLHKKLVLVSDIVDQSIEVVYGVAQQEEIRLEKTETPAEVMADFDGIVRVLVNLLSNAIKFSPKGSTVWTDAFVENGVIQIRVTDHGIGIAKEHQARIFEKYEQVEEGGKKKRGTGLGLAICRAIVEEHGGQMGVDSEPGKGSTFWFTLPCKSEGVAPHSGTANA